jgi:hypothetical protein
MKSMLKAQQSAKSLTDAVPVLGTNPDMLRLRLDGGNIAATLARRCRLKSSTRLTSW